jgi:hypothetical protein
MMGSVTLVYLVQHGEKGPVPDDPGLTVVMIAWLSR